LFAGLVVLAALGLGSAEAQKPPKLFLVSESRHGFTDTLQRIKAAAKRSGWKLPNQFDLQASMKKMGHKIPKVTVLSVCKPDLAVKILGNDRHRHLSAMMPCRLSLYEREGKTYLSRLNVGALAGQLDPAAAKVMLEAGRGVERIVKAVAR
jgi:uncharacterized protein (DUF302 family)